MKIINLAKDIQWMEPLIDTATAGCTLISLNPSGTGDASLSLQPSKTVNPSTAFQTVYPDQGYNALGSVTLNAVTAAVDSNIAPENIVEGKSILGVQGTAKAFGSYGFGDLGYDDQEAFEAYTAWILSTGGDETGLAQAIYDASVAYAALDDPMHLTPQQFSDLIDDSNTAWAHLKLMPKIAIGHEHHSEESWPVKPYEDCFKNFFAVYYPEITITAPASGVSLNRMFQNNKNVIYIHSISFPEDSVGDAPVTCDNMFSLCSSLREIHVSEGRGSIFDNKSIVSAQNMFLKCHKFTMPSAITWDNVTDMQYALGMGNSNGAINSVARHGSIEVNAPKCTDFTGLFRAWRADDGFTCTVHSDAAVTSIAYMVREVNNASGYLDNYLECIMNFDTAPGVNCNQLTTYARIKALHFRGGLQGVTDCREMMYSTTFDPDDGVIDSSLASQGLDFSGVTNTDNALRDADFRRLHGLGAIGISFQINRAQLPLEDLQAIISQAADVSATGGATMSFGSQMYDLLTETELSLATSKGWTVSKL